MKWLVTLVSIVFAASLPALVCAHAFPENSSPHVGATVTASPLQVKIWFNSDLEPLFDQLVVKDAHGQIVSVGEATVHASNPPLLEVPLKPALAPGQYHVYWQVTARDGHHTQGDFTFTLSPAQ